MRRATVGVSVGLCAGHDTCCSEMSCTTRTRLWEASATARWNSRAERVKAATSLILRSASAMSVAQPGMIVCGGVDSGELCGEAFDGALRIHDFGHRDAGKVELHGQRLGEQAGIALRDARAAAGADLDLDDALRLQRSQRIARDDAADAEPLGEILFRAEEIARAKLLGEQCLAHLRHDLGRHGRGAEGNDLALAVLHRRVKPHAGRLCDRGLRQR